jgi:hypothetical protein
MPKLSSTAINELLRGDIAIVENLVEFVDGTSTLVIGETANSNGTIEMAEEELPAASVTVTLIST